MSDIDYKALREVAEKATKGPWKHKYVEHYDQTLKCIETKDENIFASVDGPRKRNLEFIATFNPATVLRVLERLDVLEKSDAGVLTDLVKSLKAENERLKKEMIARKILKAIMEVSKDNLKENDELREKLTLSEAQLAKAMAAIEKLLVSHSNLYKSTFGEDADPNNDLIRLEGLAALAEMSEGEE